MNDAIKFRKLARNAARNARLADRNAAHSYQISTIACYRQLAADYRTEALKYLDRAYYAARLTH